MSTDSQTLGLFDWKTSSFIAPEMRLQLAAYWGCFNQPARPSFAQLVQITSQGCRAIVNMEYAELLQAYQVFLQAKSVFDWLVHCGAATIPTNEQYKVGDTYLPSVTYILRHVVAKDLLLQWYYKMGKEGKDPNQIKRERGEQGRTVHHIIRLLLQGKPVEVSEGPPWLTETIGHFSQWVVTSQFQPVAIEQPVFNLPEGYAGTLDAVGYIQRAPDPQPQEVVNGVTA